MQAMLFEFLRRGLLDANLERARALLRERRDARRWTRSSEHLGPRGATWSRPDGGYFVWLDLPDGVDADERLRPGGRGGRRCREGHRLLPARVGRRVVAAARVQLRLDGRARRGDRAASPRRAGGGGRIAATAARRTASPSANPSSSSQMSPTWALKKMKWSVTLPEFLAMNATR